MSVLPLDLQVLFTKAVEHSENIARNSNRVQNVAMEGYEKIHKQSTEVTERVSNKDEVAEDFTKVSEEGGQGAGAGLEQHKKGASEQSAEPKEYKRAPKEDGTGRIIDIVE